MLTSRTKFLIQTLTTLGYKESLRALKMMMNEMNADNGYARHDGADYYLHLVDVAQTLLNFDIRDEDTITSAILHDYLEDVPGVSKKMIESIFNKNVADIVELLSKQKNVDYHNNESRMQDYLDGIFTNESACLVKTADRMHNMGTMQGNTSFEHKVRQAYNTEKFFIPFFKKCRNEYPEHAAFFFHAKTTVEPLIFEIKQEEALMKQLDTIHTIIADSMKEALKKSE